MQFNYSHNIHTSISLLHKIVWIYLRLITVVEVVINMTIGGTRRREGNVLESIQKCKTTKMYVCAVLM